MLPTQIRRSMSADVPCRVTPMCTQSSGLESTQRNLAAHALARQAQALLLSVAAVASRRQHDGDVLRPDTIHPVSPEGWHGTGRMMSLVIYSVPGRRDSAVSRLHEAGHPAAEYVAGSVRCASTNVAIGNNYMLKSPDFADLTWIQGGQYLRYRGISATMDAVGIINLLPITTIQMGGLR